MHVKESLIKYKQEDCIGNAFNTSPRHTRQSKQHSHPLYTEHREHVSLNHMGYNLLIINEQPQNRTRKEEGCGSGCPWNKWLHPPTLLDTLKTG